MRTKFYHICRVRCRRCGDLLEYRNRSQQDRGPGRLLVCSCRKVALDPAACLYRILGEPEDYEDLSEYSESEN